MNFVFLVLLPPSLAVIHCHTRPFYILISISRIPNRDILSTCSKVLDYQKTQFVNRVVASIFNIVSGKKIAILGFDFNKRR